MMRQYCGVSSSVDVAALSTGGRGGVASAVLVGGGRGIVDSGAFKTAPASAVPVAGDTATVSREMTAGGGGGMAAAGTFGIVSFGGGGGVMDIVV